MFCSLCENNPCKALLYREGLEGELSVMSDSLPNNTKRKQLYRCYVVGEYGTLGRNNRVRIPECVVTFIRSLCPDPEGVYMGHRDVGDGTGANRVQDVCENITNESFESILPDGSSINGVTNTNFDAGEKVKVCVTFENAIFGIDAVRAFVLESPANGWHVSFVENSFTNAIITCDKDATFQEVYHYCIMKANNYSSIHMEKI
jgi:hypothetical protein